MDQIIPNEQIERMSGVVDSFATMERRYRIEDPKNSRIADFAEAARTALDNPEFYTLLDSTMQQRPDLDGPHAANLILRSVQADLIEHDDRYPQVYNSVESWLQAFDKILTNNERRTALEHKLETYIVQSNVAKRYVSTALIATLLQDRLGKHPAHLDIGPSRMHGDKKLVAQDLIGRTLPFGDVEIVSDYDSETSSSIVDSRLTSMTKTVLGQSVEFGAMAGIDITNVTDPEVIKWVKNCSFYPDELLDASRVTEYDLLDSLDPNNERVTFFQGDFSSSYDLRRFKENSPVGQYDMITFSAVLYQYHKHPAKQYAMLVNAMNLLSPDGILVVQDAPDGNFAKKYNCVTAVRDGLDLESGYQELLIWEDARCNRAALGAGKLILGDEKLTITELIERNVSSKH